MTKQILVTAGNTWAPLDDVRVITNIFSGKTGLTIAYELARRGFKVTLILADCRLSLKPFRHKRLKILRAIDFASFYKTVRKEVKKEEYSSLIHCAAVSDFYLKKPKRGKISSKKKLKLSLSRTRKIVNKVKKWDPNIRLISFKLEATKSKRKLFKAALRSKALSGADFVVANTLPQKNKSRFFLVKSKAQFLRIIGRKALAKLARIFRNEL